MLGKVLKAYVSPKILKMKVRQNYKSILQQFKVFVRRNSRATVRQSSERKLSQQKDKLKKVQYTVTKKRKNMLELNGKYDQTLV